MATRSSSPAPTDGSHSMCTTSMDLPNARVPPSAVPNAQRHEGCTGAILCDGLWMFLAPCVPLARAVSWTSGRSAAVFVFVFSALLFMGGIFCFALATTTAHPFLPIGAVSALPLGWLMSAIGPFYSLPLDGIVWFFQELRTVDCGDREPSERLPDYKVDTTSAMLTIVHLLSQCGLLLLTSIVQCDLNRQAEREANCCDCVCAACCPCVTIPRAMARAKRTTTTQARLADELPAYTV